MSGRPPRILILSAAIGEGHDLPARILADELRAEAPGAYVRIGDGLEAWGWPLERIAHSGSAFHSVWGNRIFDLEYWLLVRVPLTRRLAGRGLQLLGARGLLRVIAAERPDVVVSTYPGVTEVLGRLRRRGRMPLPVVSAITDLAALRFWAHPGVDLHLVTHPESVEEVRRIAPGSEVVPVRGLNSPDFLQPRDLAEARRALDLPPEAKVVVVSGGGWGVGDLAGAVEAVLAIDGTLAIALCGRADHVREALSARFGADPRVRAMGFTDAMSDFLAAADALVHSTAGLTVLEAHVRGCPTISYGWGRAHIRANNAAFTRFGLAEVAVDPPALAAALAGVLAAPRPPARSFAHLPSAASMVLARVGIGAGMPARDEVAHGA